MKNSICMCRFVGRWQWHLC